MIIKEIAKNKKAWHDYEVLEKYEAGIVLTGAEIKMIRGKFAQIAGSYVKILQDRENHPGVFIINMNIAKVPEPTRTRKLLLHKKEINSLIGKTEQKRLTLIPLKLYLKINRAKLLIGLCRGKKLHDKRETKKRKDQDRETRRAIKNF